jgi:hypothetical protein
VDLEGGGKDRRFVFEPLVKGREEDRQDVSAVGGDVSEEAVNKLAKMGVAARASWKNDDVDGKSVEWRVTKDWGCG